MANDYYPRLSYWTQALKKEDDDLIFIENEKLPVDSKEAQIVCDKINRITAKNRPVYPPRQKGRGTSDVSIYAVDSEIVIKIIAEQRDTGTRHVPIDIYLTNISLEQFSQTEIGQLISQVAERIVLAIDVQIGRTVSARTQSELRAGIAYVYDKRVNGFWGTFRKIIPTLVAIAFPYILYRFVLPRLSGHTESILSAFPAAMAVNNVILVILMRSDSAPSLLRSYLSSSVQK